MADKVWYTMGMTRYSDLSMIVLGVVVERITGMPIDDFTAKEIYEPVSGYHSAAYDFEYFIWCLNFLMGE